jgi:TonB family protein
MNTLCFSLLTFIFFGTPPLPAQIAADTTSAVIVAEAQDKQEKKIPADMQELDEQPTPIKTASPKYPESAMRDTLEGTIYLRVTIGQEGTIADIKIEKGVREDLNNAAIEAMKQWKPPTQKGKPVKTSVVVPFRFRLTKEKK